MATSVGFLPDAHAESGAVLVTGRAKPAHRAVVATAVTTTLRAAAWAVVEATFSPNEAGKVIACLDLDRPWVCVAPIAQQKNFERMMVVSVDDDSSQVIVTAQLLVAGDGVPPADRRVCEGGCSDAALAESASALTKELLARQAVRSGHTTIGVRTVPDGAVITLDGAMLGQSNKTLDVAPGSHTLLLQRSGYEPATRMITLAEGQNQTVEVTLKPQSGTAPGGHDRSSSWLPIALVGTGAVAVIAGVALQVSKDGPRLGDEQSPRIYSAPGIGLAVGGGLAIGAGIYLWRRGDGADPPRQSAPTVSVTEHAGVLGWAGSF
ncbi:MAG: PEGA domain-containing protein [Kofleriaceae bacterium]